MNTHIHFLFRNKQFSCNIYIDNSASPCYVFVELLDADLVAEFGKDISIKTDFEQRLPKKDDYPALVEIRQSIFGAVRLLPEFLAARQKLELLRTAHRQDEG